MNWHSRACARVEKETPGEGKRTVKCRRDARKTGDPMGNEEDVQPASPGAEIGRKREQGSHLCAGLGGQNQKSTKTD